MSKRRVERGLDDLDPDVLEALSPDARLQLFLEAAADGKVGWLERLRDTAPVARYYATERAYTERGTLALRMLPHAVYELHTTSLQYALVEQAQRASWIIDRHRDGTPTEAELDAAEARVTRLQAFFATLYLDYHAYRRFATEVLGVDLETWFQLHPEGPLVLDRVEADLENKRMITLAEEFLRDDLGLGSGDEEASVLEERTEVRYQGLVAGWEDVVSAIDE